MAGENNSNSLILYSTRAHVFQIDPETRSSWIQRGDSAIPISFVASTPSQNRDSTERQLRIVGEAKDGEIVLDSIITSKTGFAKRTPKFGQWQDATGAVCGLGFAFEAELAEFNKTFEKLQVDILSPSSRQLHHQQLLHQQQQQQALLQQQQNQSQIISAAASTSQSQTVSLADRSALNQQNSNNISETNGRTPNGSNGIVNSAQEYSNTLSHPGDQQQLRRKRNGNTSLTNGDNEGSGDPNLSGYPRSQSMMGLAKANNSATSKWPQEPRNSPRPSQSEWPQNEPLNVEQLRYENDRLKQALEEVSKNAGMWNDELRNLKTNNFKLTEALRESRTHVEEWERELLSVREENKSLKLRVLASESSEDPEKSAEYKKELHKYKSYIDEVQSELRRKETEIDDLQKSLQDLELKNKVPHDDQHEGLPEQNAQILQRQQELEVINAKLESKIKGLVDIQKDFKQIVQSFGG